MASPLPLVAMALAGGAVIIFYGARQTKTALAGAVPAAASNTAAPAGASGGTAADRATLEQLAGQHGWNGAEVTAWEEVINLEDASWSLTAKNPTSGAYGIAQGITGPGWYATEGGDVGTVVGQLTAMGNYIAQRYGSPSKALTFHLSNGYY